MKANSTLCQTTVHCCGFSFGRAVRGMNMLPKWYVKGCIIFSSTLLILFLGIIMGKLLFF